MSRPRSKQSPRVVGLDRFECSYPNPVGEVYNPTRGELRAVNPMVVKTIVHFEIPATDADKLVHFYREVFGWKFEKAPIPGMDYWLITTGPRGKSVGGGMFRKMRPGDRPRNFIHVDQIDEAIRTFKSAGGTEVVGKMEVPGMGWSFIGADPEGNHIALWKPMMPMRARPRSRTRTARKKR